ncbi:MAG: hypothetical protein ABWK01_03585 [Infirmifilum sp.]
MSFIAGCERKRLAVYSLVRYWEGLGGPQAGIRSAVEAVYRTPVPTPHAEQGRGQRARDPAQASNPASAVDAAPAKTLASLGRGGGLMATRHYTKKI